MISSSTLIIRHELDGLRLQRVCLAVSAQHRELSSASTRSARLSSLLRIAINKHHERRWRIRHMRQSSDGLSPHMAGPLRPLSALWPR
jgi:hypothetical protein